MRAVLATDPILPVQKRSLSIALRWLIGIVGLGSLLLLSVGASRFINDAVRFPVSNVDVSGTLDYTDRGQLRQLVSKHTHSGFYGLNIDDIQATIVAMPWVARVHVRRIWPGRLSIEVEEHEPAARWNRNAMISKRMEMFRPPQLDRDSEKYTEWQSVFATLPKLSGADGQHESVLSAYRRYQQRLRLFKVSLVALNEDERRSQTLELSNNVSVRLGYKQRELRFGRFVDIYQRLVAPLNGQAARFDMRYSNGFALSGSVAMPRES